MPEKETVIRMQDLLNDKRSVAQIADATNTTVGTTRRYVWVIGMIKRGKSDLEISQSSSLSLETVKGIRRWVGEQDPGTQKPEVDTPESSDNLEQADATVTDNGTLEIAKHPKKLLELARLIEKKCVIPPVARISGVDTGEWSRGYYGSLNRNPRLAIESDPIFKDVVATYDVVEFELAIAQLKSCLLEYSTAAQKLATAITEQIQLDENRRAGDSGLIEVPAGLLLAVMHHSLERESGVPVKQPPINVTGDLASGFVIELGGWRAEYVEKTTAESVAANFGTMIERASGISESDEVEESYSACGEALAEVISTLMPKRRTKI